jgi:hypothetical protein
MGTSEPRCARPPGVYARAVCACRVSRSWHTHGYRLPESAALGTACTALSRRPAEPPLAFATPQGRGFNPNNAPRKHTPKTSLPQQLVCLLKFSMVRLAVSAGMQLNLRTKVSTCCEGRPSFG